MNANHAPFSFAQIREATGARLDGEGETVGVVTDSRQVGPNNLFLALKGEKFDGNAFIPEAEKKGSIALGEKNVGDTQKALGDLARYHRNRFPIPVVAVTGSYGKTTTRALIFAALSAQFKTLTSEGNFNNEIGLPMTIFQLNGEHEAAVLEMGMRGRGQIEYLAQIALPTVGVLTNIGPQHIELLGSVENIAAAKAELLEHLPADGLAVVPADTPFLEFLLRQAKCRVVTFGTSEAANYRVQNVSAEGAERLKFSLSIPISPKTNASFLKTNAFSLKTNATFSEQNKCFQEKNEGFQESCVDLQEKNEGFQESCVDLQEKDEDRRERNDLEQPFQVVLPLIGAHNALNAAAAFAVAHQLGVAPDEIIESLQTAQIPGARMRIVKAETLTVIDDCYNAGPDSMRAALETLLDFPGSGRRVAVLGAMKELGAFSEAEHRKIGALAGTICEVLIGVGGETRPLLNAAMEAAKQNETELAVLWCESAEVAAGRVGEWILAGDVVLVKGSRSVGLERVVEQLKGDGN